MSDSSLPPVIFLGGLITYVRYVCLFAYSGVFFVLSCVSNVVSIFGLSFFYLPFDVR